MADQKRREQRIRPGGVSLWLRIEDRATICPVLNISRLGIAIELPSDDAADNLPSFTMGSVLKATLKIAGKTMSIGLRVLRLKGSQLGCSFDFPDDATQTALAQCLSPHFVSTSLEKVSPHALQADVKEAFFGSDFSVIILREQGKVRISTAGFECQINPEGIQIVRPALSDMDADFLSEDFLLTSAHSLLPKDDVSDQAIAERIVRVLESWSERPAEAHRAIEQLRGKYAC